jgi:hypothetical protein
MKEEKEIRWVALHELPGKVYADMVMEVLKQHNIPCYLKSFSGSGAIGVISGAGLFGSRDKIMVPEDRYDEASEILHSMLDHI